MSELSAGNLEAISYHLEKGNDNGDVSRDVLALQLRSVARELLAAAAARDELKRAVAELTQARDFNAGIIDGLNSAISIKDDVIEAQAAQLEQAQKTIDGQMTVLKDVTGLIVRIHELADDETSTVEIATESNMWQIEADTRSWLSANAPAPEEEERTA